MKVNGNLSRILNLLEKARVESNRLEIERWKDEKVK